MGRGGQSLWGLLRVGDCCGLLVKAGGGLCRLLRVGGGCSGLLTTGEGLWELVSAEEVMHWATGVHTVGGLPVRPDTNPPHPLPAPQPPLDPPTHTRVGETPGKRVGATERGRGRARGWHTRVTARLRQGGQTYRQGRQREGEWEVRQASEGAQGSGTGVAQRRAQGTRRARGSSGEHEHG